jgi:hypothetical protein
MLNIALFFNEICKMHVEIIVEGNCMNRKQLRK